MNRRRDKINYYLDIAEIVLERSTCLRRQYGAVIVNNDEVISSGYVGAPRGRTNCIDRGVCLREKLMIPKYSYTIIFYVCHCNEKSLNFKSGTVV